MMTTHLCTILGQPEGFKLNWDWRDNYYGIHGTGRREKNLGETGGILNYGILLADPDN